MESLYYVMAWACHRKCRHCYEDRFRPYIRDGLDAVIAEAEANFPRVIANLPDRMTWIDRTGPAPVERGGRIILSGGEALLDATRERVTYKVIEALRRKYAGQGVKITVQTTGDLLTPTIVRELVARGVWMISIASLDDFHVGMEGPAKQAAFRAHLENLFADAGVRLSMSAQQNRAWHSEDGPLYSIFGATPGSWIGKLWPRGRAWENGLSSAGMADNFCNRWSGGLNFLNHGEAGSEVSVEPDGLVYPCCIKTKLPIGSLLEEPLLEILELLADDPAYQAINAGAPQRMGLHLGWSEDDFIAKSRTVTPQGQPYENLCIGCDAFHAEVLAPTIEAARRRRADARQARAA